MDGEREKERQGVSEEDSTVMEYSTGQKETVKGELPLRLDSFDSCMRKKLVEDKQREHAVRRRWVRFQGRLYLAMGTLVMQDSKPG